ncbi:MAG: response regulator [Candidatus Aminicenantes bacterium]|nr:response regulator [Candidatus Aminicenantes bacterium]
MPKILVIEDEPDQSKLIKLRLEARGYEVMSVAKAREGIELARKVKPQLILMDMILPDMHGLDATIKLKASPETRDIPVIALSAVGSPDFIKACSQEGVAVYVKKPYDPKELFKTIERFIKIEEVEKKPKAKVKRGDSIDEMLKAALSDFKIPGEKTAGAKEERARRTGRKKSGPGSILIVDDDTSFGKAACATLSGRGYEVTIAFDSVSGLKQAFEKKPDLILLNLVLPAGGGESVLANLRKAPETEHIPVFIMSSLFSPKKLEDKARTLGAQGFIAKPIEPENLLYIIESIIGE